ncbi:MAG: hypothetical protein RIR12_211 [Bacteroidota bacterium]|jgi:hypothetical protein
MKKLLGYFFIISLSAHTQGQKTKLHLQDVSTYKVSVSYSNILMAKNDTFRFSLNTGEKIIIDFTNREKTFARQFLPGETYKITQIAGPRTCSMWSQNSEGTISNTDITVGVNCGYPPRVNGLLEVSGVAPNETFIFSNEYGNSYYVTLNRTYPIQNFPIGDYYFFKQVGGPRTCKITNGQGTVTSTSLSIKCDCSKPIAALPQPPKNIYDLVSRSSDDKIISTYYESWSPVVGGKGVDEGRYVAFSMYGKGIDGSTGNHRQIFWRDRKLGITKLISKNAQGAEGDANSLVPSISADGQAVAFESYAKNLCDGDLNGIRDVFVWNAFIDKVTLISKGMDGGTANYESSEPVISGDGSAIAYTSYASNIVHLEPVFSTPNVYVHNLGSGTTDFITKDYETGKAAGGYAPTISDDGNKVAFCAFTYRLVANDNNNLWDIFLWQKGKLGLKKISVTATGADRNQGTESSSRVVYPAISGNGEYIAYSTTSSNLVPDDTNKFQDVFIYNISTGSVKRVSHLNNKIEGDGDSPVTQGERVGISYDGSWIAYNTNATNFGVPKGNIVIQSTQTGKIIPITKITHGSTARPMLSRYGNYIVAGCSEMYDKRFASSGLFAIYTNIGPCNNCTD